MDRHSFSAADHHAALSGADNGFPWFAGAMLALESCDVMRMRLDKLARADEEEAEQEAVLMVGEKLAAAYEAISGWLAGAMPAAIINRYREYVAANAERLSANQH